MIIAFSDFQMNINGLSRGFAKAMATTAAVGSPPTWDNKDNNMYCVVAAMPSSKD